jgi:hypothetical protein
MTSAGRNGRQLEPQVNQAAVAQARDRIERSADELCAYTQLSPGRVDEFRDLMIFT